ncbi:Crp/Fnr family transcriptional regulator [Methylomonas sp. AM2-LC]|uniref:Crp/Fnr family transcriptional regulator n=1 Tax=Methylomonas sp. AM2-LC TaxID=3153301 RepID=UPI0032671171
MTSYPPKFAANRLLAALPTKEREQLIRQCDLIQLHFADVLYSVGDSIRHVYFPTGGYISLLTPLEAGARLEIGQVGNEGMLGTSLLLEVDIAPFQAMVQGTGSALRISATAFIQELEKNPLLWRLLKRYLYISISQIAQSAACCRIHVVEERLARWLLMTQDRAHSNCFHITHIVMACMLGVRRVGITKAASALQRQNIISYQRGNIEIIDRIGLENAACNCYELEKQIYETIMTPTL